MTQNRSTVKYKTKQAYKLLKNSSCRKYCTVDKLTLTKDKIATNNTVEKTQLLRSITKIPNIMKFRESQNNYQRTHRRNEALQFTLQRFNPQPFITPLCFVTIQINKYWRQRMISSCQPFQPSRKLSNYVSEWVVILPYRSEIHLIDNRMLMIRSVPVGAAH